eukprot:124137-Pyramimonas_sp.AAC.1
MFTRWTARTGSAHLPSKRPAACDGEYTVWHADTHPDRWPNQGPALATNENCRSHRLISSRSNARKNFGSGQHKQLSCL